MVIPTISPLDLLMLLLLSRFSRVRLCAANQAPPSLRVSMQEYWSGLPLPSPMNESEKWKWSCPVMSDSSRPHGLQPTRLLRPWDFPGNGLPLPSPYAYAASVKDRDGCWKITMEHHNLNQVVTPNAAAMPDGAGSKESTCQCRRHKRFRFNPWIGKIPWRRKWHPTPPLLLEESHGQRRLVCYSPWGCKE